MLPTQTTITMLSEKGTFTKNVFKIFTDKKGIQNMGFGPYLTDSPFKIGVTYPHKVWICHLLLILNPKKFLKNLKKKKLIKKKKKKKIILSLGGGVADFCPKNGETIIFFNITLICDHWVWTDQSEMRGKYGA